MLTYKNVLDKNHDVKEIKVKLDKKTIGKIKISKFVCDKTHGTKKTFQYFAKGSKKGGEVFYSFSALERSLED